MSGVHRQELNSLQPGAQNALVIGIIMHSFNMKTFDSTRSRFNHGERGVWTFTLRDSEEDTINVTVWGSVQFVKKLSSNFHIGSVVEVINPKVLERRPEDRNELFVPSVSSQCNLTVNEGKALVQAHDAPTRSKYEPLLMLPIRSLATTRCLKSIFENLETLRDQYVDVLVVVTFIGDIRNVITRDGRSIRFRNFEAADGSTDEVASLVLWENEWINRAAYWGPRRTVLLFTDARIAYDNFKKTIVLSIARKTLIIENPDVPEATTVRDSVRYYDPDVMSGNTFATPNPDSISTVMTIQDISNKLNKQSKEGKRIQFAAILKAYIMDMNVDSLNPGIISRRCALCKRTVLDENDSCMNLECPSGNGSRVPMNVMSLNLKAMIIPQREDLKWKYALEKCEIRLHILGPTSAFPNAVYNILSIISNEDEDENGNTQPLDEFIDMNV
nr:meiosis-specific with OB domain-containing protein isoform X2 [Nomia melanderi]